MDDIRNPYSDANNSSENEIKEEGFEPKPRKHCYCDNCIYGRTELAEYILKLLNYEQSSSAVR